MTEEQLCNAGYSWTSNCRGYEVRLRGVFVCAAAKDKSKDCDQPPSQVWQARRNNLQINQRDCLLAANKHHQSHCIS